MDGVKAGTSCGNIEPKRCPVNQSDDPWYALERLTRIKSQIDENTCHFFHCDSHFQPGELGAQAVVRTESECNAVIWVPSWIEDIRIGRFHFG